MTLEFSFHNYTIKIMEPIFNSTIMSSNLIRCDSCFYEVDPVLSGLQIHYLNCSHKICSNCYNPDLFSVCPSCATNNIPFSQDLDSFYDFSLTDFGMNMPYETEQPTNNLCVIHQQPKDWVCVTDKTTLCKHCLYHGTEHDNHIVESISEIRNKAKEKANRLKAKQEKLKEARKNISGDLTKNEEASCHLVKKCLESIRDCISRKEEEIFSEIGVTYLQKKMKLDESISRGADSLKLIDNQISLLNTNDINADFMQVLNQDILIQMPQLNPQDIIKEEPQIDEKQLTTGFQSLYAAIVNKVQSFPPLFPPKELTSSSQGIIEIPVVDYKYFSIKHFISLREVEDGHIKISAALEEDLNNNIDLSRLKEATKVTLDFERQKLTTETMKAICYFWDEFKSVMDINMNLNNPDFGNEELSALSQYKFWSRHQVKTVHINLSRTNVGDISACELLVQKLSKMINLLNLELNLSYTRVTDRSMSEFAKSTLSKLVMLETLNINISDTCMTTACTEEILATILRNKKNLKSFILSVRKTLITADNVKSIEKKLSTLEGLKFFVSLKTEV